MVKRLKIGLIYTYNKDWIAGAYYILNLIQALNRQPDEEKPELFILSYSEEEFKNVKDTGYPYLQFIQLKKTNFHGSYSRGQQLVNKITTILFKKNVIKQPPTSKRLNTIIDLLFPASTNLYFEKIKHKLFWIPDFQECYLPQFFSNEEIISRKLYKDELAQKAHPIVFSSHDAQQDFKKNYPLSRAATFVLQFAVTHPTYEHIPVSTLSEKYKIDRPYFFSPNQFWAHKNHLVILKAISLLKNEKSKPVLVLFSGKEDDYRNPEHFGKLRKYVEENNIGDCVKFLGFIERDEQLQLMNNAIAVLQPSLFEGWSTVVEDAKAMKQHVILSDIPVHREQLESNVTFFNPYHAEELATILDEFKGQQREENNYSTNVQDFGKKFIEIAYQINR